jgi:hypothetical protein
MNTYNLNLKPFLILFLIFITVSSYAQSVATVTQNNVGNIENSLQYIKKLEPKVFAGNEYGFVAEDVQKVLPGIVKDQYRSVPMGKNQYRTKKVQTISMESLVPILVGSIKEQQAEIEALKSELNQLKQNNKELSK